MQAIAPIKKNSMWVVNKDDEPFIKCLKNRDIKDQGKYSASIDKVFEALFKQNGNSLKLPLEMYYQGLQTLGIYLT